MSWIVKQVAYTPLYLRLPEDGISAPKHVAVIGKISTICSSIMWICWWMFLAHTVCKLFWAKYFDDGHDKFSNPYFGAQFTWRDAVILNHPITLEKYANTLVIFLYNPTHALFTL